MHAPELLEKYNKHIVSNPAVELIHASCDDVEEEALEWARKASFPWPTILMPEWEAVGLHAYGAGAGEILLIDSAGKILAKDEKDAFAKISGLK